MDVGHDTLCPNSEPIPVDGHPQTTTWLVGSMTHTHISDYSNKLREEGKQPIMKLKWQIGQLEIKMNIHQFQSVTMNPLNIMRRAASDVGPAQVVASARSKPRRTSCGRTALITDR